MTIQRLYNNAEAPVLQLELDQHDNYAFRSFLSLLDISLVEPSYEPPTGPVHDEPASQNYFAFFTKIMEIYEKSYNEEDCSREQDLVLPTRLTVESCESCSDELVEKLVLNVSAQPWVIPPTFEATANNWQLAINGQQTTLRDIRVENLYAGKSHLSAPDTTENYCEVQDHEMDHLRFSCSADFTTQHVVTEHKISDFSLNETACIEKYEAFNKSLHKQVVDEIIMHDFFDADTLEITLYPESLGSVTIKCEIDESLTINISSDKFSTLTLLQHNAIDLKNIIAANIASGSCEIQMQFNMDHKEQRQNRNENANLNLAGMDKATKPFSEISMHFSHNGIVNFIV